MARGMRGGREEGRRRGEGRRGFGEEEKGGRRGVGGEGGKERCVHTSNTSATVDIPKPQLPMSSLTKKKNLNVDVEVPGLNAESVILA